MSKIDKVYNLVNYTMLIHKDEKSYKGISTSEVAKKLNIYRTEASSLLNKLVSEGKLAKYGTRPVLYATVELERESILETNQNELQKSCLDQIIGADSSLKYQIDLARSAVSYPPLGLHTLITGESGTGKSMLAEKMWEYACEIKKRSDIPFITFSCAEYADNPQLILEQLFGHKKGAFTGAAQDRPGLVEKANGGILFLDEIHRLPPTCQELLFILMDKGMIRRIGDNEDIPISLQIIGATSENITNILLKTFRRRMPVTIYMPTLAERSTSEHLSLIKLFLQEEAIKIKKNIHITGKALQAFLNYNGEGNIGDLKSNLLISCAKSFIHSKSNTLTITVYDIPQLVYITNKEIDHSYSPYIQEVSKNGITFYADKRNIAKDYFQSQNFDLYHFSKTHIPDFDSSTKEKENTSIDNDYIERYYEQSLSNLKLKHLEKESVPDTVIEATTYIIRSAYINKGRAFDEAIQSAIMLHLKQFYYLIKSNHVIYNPELKKITMYYEKEVQLVKEMLPRLQEIFGVNILDDEIGFLSILLSKTANKKAEMKRKILIISFGSSVASSIVSFAKQAIDIDCFDFLNIPFTTTTDDLFHIVANKINQLHNVKELLILTDISSLYNGFFTLKKNISVPCEVLPVISSIVTLEASKLIYDHSKTLSSIVNDIKHNYLNYITTLFNESTSPLDNINEKDNIIIYSTHGLENAKVISNILLKKIKLSQNYKIKYASNTKDIKEIEKEYTHIRFILGNIHPSSDLPFYGYENLLFKEGIQKISVNLQYEDILFTHSDSFLQKPVSRNTVNDTVKSVINDFAPSFSPDDLFQSVKSILEELEMQIFHRTLPFNTYARGLLYLISLAENKKRSPSEKIIDNKNKDKVLEKAKEIINFEFSKHFINIPVNEVKLLINELLNNG